MALELTSLAIGFALSPLPLLELILVLFSKRRTVNTIVFVGGIVLLSAVGVLLGVAGAGANNESGGPSRGAAVVLLVLGAALLLVAVGNWRNRRDESEPAVLAKISGMGPGTVAVLLVPGATLANPKNLVMLVSAGAVIEAGASGAEAVLLGLAFVAVATLPITAAAAYALIGGEPAAHNLDRMRAWLVRKNRLIMAVVCAVLGLALLGKAWSALV